MSNSEVFGSPMNLTGNRPVRPFGAAPDTTFRKAAAARTGRGFLNILNRLLVSMKRRHRVRKTVIELSRLEDYMLRDIGLNRSGIFSTAHEIEERRRAARGRFPM
jgi:uncharacterized protein YjiS (DUF1127 family)